MCGIAGIASWRHESDLDRSIRAMAGTMLHRGPDDGSHWIDSERGVALGHRRLSIIDLSPTGQQPMACASGHRVMVFNGEIYNFGALRDELERANKAPPWRGHSDTEVLLAAINAWGLEAASAEAGASVAARKPKFAGRPASHALKSCSRAALGHDVRFKAVVMKALSETL